jgi:hypothetical protein
MQSYPERHSGTQAEPVAPLLVGFVRPSRIKHANRTVVFVAPQPDPAALLDTLCDSTPSAVHPWAAPVSLADAVADSKLPPDAVTNPTSR